MIGQLDMFLPVPVGTEAADGIRHKRKSRPDRPSIGARFEAFHKAHPDVLEHMMRLCRARTDRGETRIAVKALWEELRSSLAITHGGKFKLDNSYTALYARKLIELEPALQGVIETRKRKAK